jgi:DNA-directed RNA polymerase subunit RPC12/RpoP
MSRESRNGDVVRCNWCGHKSVPVGRPSLSEDRERWWGDAVRLATWSIPRGDGIDRKTSQYLCLACRQRVVTALDDARLAAEDQRKLCCDE